MVIMLTSLLLLITGCSSDKQDSAKTGGSAETVSSAEEADSTSSETSAEGDYDNSFCKDGVPSKTLTDLREKGTLVVGSSGDAPFAYIDQASGEFKGVDAEIIKEAAKRLGIKKVEMKLIPFSELILNLNSGNIDIISDCMYIRADRAEQVYFGEIWYTQGGGLLVPEDSTINGIEDFDPKSTVVGYTAGTVWQTAVEAWKEQGLIKEARATGDQSESIVALQYGKIDAFLTDSTVLENLFANSPDTVKGLKMCENYKDDESTIGRIAPAVTFDDIAFMKEIDAVVAKLRDEGFIKKVFEDYKLNPDLHMITNEERTHDINTRTE
jgi:polar amino acid transport system substrate-binding protein